MPHRLSSHQILVCKIIVFVILLLPVTMTAFRLPNAGDPVELLTKESGEFALRILILTLLMTPLQNIFGWHLPARLRRMLGLYAFSYALVHFTVYVVLDLQFNFAGVWEDIVKRKYITVGFIAFLLMLPLAVTSNDSLLRRLGFTRWKKLHRAIYLIAPLAALHFFWQVRGKDWGEPLIYFGIITVLLFLRIPSIATKVAKIKRH